MLAQASNPRPSPLPLPAALVVAELGPVVMADDPCEAAFGSVDPTGPRKYYRARYYDPGVGRFISEDPTQFSAGINFYVYANDSPTVNIDPLGRASVPAHRTADAVPDINTIVCDGMGRPVIQPGDPRNPNGNKCVMGCILGHEGKHLINALQLTPGVCAGQPAGVVVVKHSTRMKYLDEIDAYNFEVKCLESCPCALAASRRRFLLNQMLPEVHRALRLWIWE